MRLDGKVALVTGAARGIGRGIALRLAAEGARIVINDLQANDATVAVAGEVEARGSRALVCAADVSDRAAVAEWASSLGRSTMVIK